MKVLTAVLFAFFSFFRIFSVRCQEYVGSAVHDTFLDCAGIFINELTGLELNYLPENDKYRVRESRGRCNKEPLYEVGDLLDPKTFIRSLGVYPDLEILPQYESIELEDVNANHFSYPPNCDLDDSVFSTHKVNGFSRPKNYTQFIVTFGAPSFKSPDYDATIACFILRNRGENCEVNKEKDRVIIKHGDGTETHEYISVFPPRFGVPIDRLYLMEGVVYDVAADYYIIPDKFGCSFLLMKNSLGISRFFVYPEVKALFSASNDDIVRAAKVINMDLTYQESEDIFVDTKGNSAVTYDRYTLFPLLIPHVNDILEALYDVIPEKEILNSESTDKNYSDVPNLKNLAEVVISGEQNSFLSGATSPITNLEMLPIRLKKKCRERALSLSPLKNQGAHSNMNVNNRTFFLNKKTLIILGCVIGFVLVLIALAVLPYKCYKHLKQSRSSSLIPISM